MEALKDKTVATLVTENIQTAHVFKKYGIDFCCGGGVSIARACEKAGVNFPDLEKELLKVGETASRATNYNSWELDFLTDHIINVHHSYVEESIPLLIQYAAKVTKVHGGHYTELLRIQQLFTAVAIELSGHMRKEEFILFPYIKKLVKAKREGLEMPQAQFGTVDNPIRMMEAEHEKAGELMKKIARLSNDYTPPEEACNSYRAFYAKLEEFEQDLHQHIHLENNILFPKVLKLEREMR